MCAAGRGLVLLLLAVCWTAAVQGKRTKKPRGPDAALQGPGGPRPLELHRGKGWKRRPAADTVTTHSSRDRAQQGLLPPPADTWRAFIQHSEDAERRARQRRRKQKRRRVDGELPRPLLRGPPGPVGPPGPPGAVVTGDLLVQELRQMIQEAAGEHLSSLLNAANKTDSEGGSKVRLPSLFQLEEVALVSRVQAAFHVRLAEKVPIPRKMFVELNKYQLPFGGGAFQRGDAIDLETGRFRAPENGVYQFSAQIFLRRKSHEGPRPKRRLSVSGQTRGDKLHHKLFRVLICIDSLCRRNSSLQFITSLEATARVFTAGIHGVLQLTKGQYVSVHVDNASHYRLVVLKNSQFSGAMLGQ